MYPYRLFGSIWAKKNISPANVSFFHNRLETFSVKLHCYVCTDVAHDKKLDYIQPNRFLCLQIKPLRMSSLADLSKIKIIAKKKNNSPSTPVKKLKMPSAGKLFQNY